MSSINLQRGLFYPFVLFMFLSMIFCGVSRVNILFHITLALFIITMIINSETRIRFINDRDFLPALGMTGAFLLYFSLSNLWAESSHLSSAISHSFYLFIFLCLYRQCELQERKKYIIGATYFGIVALTILTLVYVNKEQIFQNRLTHAFPFSPDNVIDLGGYMALGILLSAILVRETRNYWFYIPVPLLLVCLILTQSRGPFLSMIVAAIVAFLCKPKWNFKLLAGSLIVLLAIGSILYFSGFFDIFLKRAEESSRAGSVRFGIWQHAFEIAKQKMIFGWGFNKELEFINGYGQPVTTTHSLYLATFLKGGVVGLLLLLSMVLFAGRQCLRHLAANHKAEIAVIVFALMFYVTQGMFVISNPREYWVLFWLPLAIIFSTPVKTALQK
ncbi:MULTISPECIES: O-antigen ligase family protein [Enterobacter]|jgi:O-antigen ligase|uniref:O-antigen ligase domain-containing protein n=1 Tax=Enterobacter bugandensis TaxID=881260 RepID=A0ABX4VJL0_9ENTR|nr:MULTISPECIES: O-antigen ligase family protein [Enterobacter]MBE4915312.1 O-antigen ligase family protein [Enterobacter cloacae complex sp. P4RS]MBE4991391.1 O-antigen ligase family protein [Enterobacter cloacae complex sp. P6RS]MBZ6368659.1 O-antigen ligase family protein [Enterobacter bugandensis]MCK6699477.1 O-antigen ligase family protein [Enterobacter bugandensis]MCK6762355.1 O-antigen ligase family protein [Enterobacter bugandensis]